MKPTAKQLWKRAWTRARAFENARFTMRDHQAMNHLCNAMYQTSGWTRRQKAEQSSWLCMANGVLIERQRVNYREMSLEQGEIALRVILEHWDDIWLPRVEVMDNMRERIQNRAA